MASVSDNMGHLASDFCTNGSIRKHRNLGESRYSLNCYSFAQVLVHVVRLKVLYHSRTVYMENRSKHLVITTSSAEKSMNCPMFAISTKLLKRTLNMRKNCTGKKVLSVFLSHLCLRPWHLHICLQV